MNWKFLKRKPVNRIKKRPAKKGELCRYMIVLMVISFLLFVGGIILALDLLKLNHMIPKL